MCCCLGGLLSPRYNGSGRCFDNDDPRRWWPGVILRKQFVDFSRSDMFIRPICSHLRLALEFQLIIYRLSTNVRLCLRHNHTAKKDQSYFVPSVSLTNWAKTKRRPAKYIHHKPTPVVGRRFAIIALAKTIRKIKLKTKRQKKKAGDI